MHGLLSVGRGVGYFFGGCGIGARKYGGIGNYIGAYPGHFTYIICRYHIAGSIFAGSCPSIGGIGGVAQGHVIPVSLGGCGFLPLHIGQRQRPATVRDGFRDQGHIRTG